MAINILPNLKKKNIINILASNPFPFYHFNNLYALVLFIKNYKKLYCVCVRARACACVCLYTCKHVFVFLKLMEVVYTDLGQIVNSLKMFSRGPCFAEDISEFVIVLTSRTSSTVVLSTIMFTNDSKYTFNLLPLFLWFSPVVKIGLLMDIALFTFSLHLYFSTYLSPSSTRVEMTAFFKVHQFLK